MDLPHGRIDSGGPEAERVVALPATWFGEALEGLTDGRDAFADRLVGAIVREAAAALDDAAASAPDEVAWALSIALARRGLGLAAFERRGDALLFVWRSAPVKSAAFREFSARLASKAVGELLGLNVHGVALGDDASALHIALLSPDEAAALRARADGNGSIDAALDLLIPGDDA